MTRLLLVLVALLVAVPAFAQQPTVYIEPADGFEVYLAAAMSKKKVPVTVMTKAENATYTLKAAGVETEEVGTSRRVVNCLFAGCGGNENKASTSVQVINADGAIVWSYAVNKGRGAKNLQSMAEAVAEHFKNDYLKKQKH